MKFEIVVLSGCPYSERALAMLKRLPVVVECHRIGAAEKEYWKEKNNMRTFPQIFKTEVRRRRIGGLDDLIRFLHRRFKDSTLVIK